MAQVYAFANPAAGPVVPGKSLGKLSLGMTSAQFTEVFESQPVNAKTRPNGTKTMDWVYQDGEVEDTTSVTFTDDMAIYIEVTSSEFVVPGSFTTNNNLAEVFTKYKNLTTTAYETQASGYSPQYYFYSDKPKGVNFVVKADDYFDHSRVISAISVCVPNANLVAPPAFYEVEPTLNKPRPAPPKPTGRPLTSPDGLPLTELIYPNGVRGWMSSPVVLDNGVGLMSITLNSYQGKRIPVDISLSLSSQSAQPRWTGITQTTLNFSGRRVLMTGEKNTTKHNAGDYLERLTLQIPLKDFIAISNSNGVVFEVGHAKLSFKKENLGGLRALVTKIQ